MSLNHFVVTGCARSGTAYMGTVLTALGLRCGHEVLFGPRTRTFHGFGDQHGDSSWLAAPFLGSLDDALVFHQLRHPLRVVRSLVGVRFLTERSAAFLYGDDLYTRVKWQVRRQLQAHGHVTPSTKGPRPHRAYRAFLDTYEPSVWAPPTEVERALTYWLRWTERIRAFADRPTYTAHHVETLDAHTVTEVARRIGLDVSIRHVSLVLENIPRDLNTRRVAGLDWDDIPDGSLKRDAERVAGSLGYDPRDTSARPVQPLP